MPKFSGGILPLLNEPVKLHHLCCDVLEQVDAHPKTPPKIAFKILMSTHASVLVDSVGPPSAEVCRAAASFP
jgi:hypothetical protein